MKVNKKIVASLLVGSFLLTSGGLAIADDSNKKEFEPRQPMYGKMLREDRPQACWEVFDELVKENKITQEQANNIKEAMQEKMNKQQGERRQQRDQQINTNLEAMVSDGTINSEQANAIKEQMQKVATDRKGKMGQRARMMQTPTLLQDLVDQSVLTEEQANLVAQQMCRFK